MNIIHWIGIDDHADNWTIAHYAGNEEKPNDFGLVPNQEGYRKLIGFAKALDGEVRIAYEAGPCGYELYRRLTKAGLNCRVAAPSLTPVKPGQKVKTNRLDARKIARSQRAGELTYIWVPDQEQESLRDVIRARQEVQKTIVRLRNQITKLILRYGHRYRDGKAWTGRFWTWLKTIQVLSNTGFVLEELKLALIDSTERLKRFDDKIAQLAQEPKYQPYIDALRVLRGIDTLSAMVLLSELGDLRRFESAPQLMAAIGVVPSESSTGDKTNRYSITKTGNAHVRHILVEASWHYRHRVTEGRTIKARRKGRTEEVVKIAQKCDLRLNRKFHRMIGRGKLSTVAAVAVARELAGFIWAIGQVVHP